MWLNLLRSPLTWLLIALLIALGGWGWSATSAATAEGQVTALQADLQAAGDKAKEAEQRERSHHHPHRRTDRPSTGSTTTAAPAWRADHHGRYPGRHHQEAQT